ncbi:MAG TPA: hypothetical protein VKQ71_03510, partial [Acidimicrobiales bacterium]|nr:hypothetical protein [Acidimicrobiales bacterium]
MTPLTIVVAETIWPGAAWNVDPLLTTTVNWTVPPLLTVTPVADALESSISTPPASTVVPLTAPPELTCSLPPLSTTVPIAAAPESTYCSPAPARVLVELWIIVP